MSQEKYELLVELKAIPNEKTKGKGNSPYATKNRIDGPFGRGT